jgi:hypothetical protein
MDKKKIIAVVGVVLLGILTAVLKEDVKGLVCGTVEAPAAAPVSE